MATFQRPSKQAAKETIKELTQRYFKFQDTYKSTKYNEAQIRIELINPFFKALGWNLDNTGLDPDKREVIVETSVEVYDELSDKQKATKHPDYGFYYRSTQAKFYVEAKHPLVNLSTKPEPSFQLRRYAYSDRLPVSILTDFEEFVVYDCTVQPLFNDKNVRGFQLKYLTYLDYVKEFDYLWEYFSYEAIEQKRFDEFVKKDTKRRGASNLDSDFVQSLDQWRELLARNIFQNNPSINTEDLNFAVQNILDRIIFLRVCEDRDIEPYEQLKGACRSKGKHYDNLVSDFKRASLRYNSDLFNFDRDKITPKLKISDETIESIINDLYVPKSPYVFKIIPVEILGNAYERFLGKTITVNAKKQVIIEEKPEVRKAGGVFYTPQYIVNYIVENTVGRLLNGKTPEQVSDLHILDPSCGSGSFLIGVYQFLLDWHKLYYQKNATKYAKAKIKPFRSDGALTNAERKRILLNNVYGVDIDQQATEVTKLSLLLKALEGETAESVRQQLTNAFDRVLPSLDNNIRCGNSLVSTNFKSLTLSKADIDAINPFDWKDVFKPIFDDGGFDAIVGNPPYARLQTLQEFQPFAVPYFRQHYKAATTGNFDIYVLFIERAYQLIKSNGLLGFIQPHKFFQADFGEGIRQFLAHEKSISEIVHFGAAQVFADATTYTCLLFLQKKQRKNFYFVKVHDLETPNDTLRAILDNKQDRYEATDIEQPKDGTKWNFGSDSNSALLDKIKQQPQTLADVTRKIFVGLQTSADKIYVLSIIEERSKTWRCFSKSLDREIEIEKGLVKPFLMGKDVKKYEKPKPNNVCIFPYDIIEGKAQIMQADNLKKQFPKGWQYILDNKKELEGRENGKMKHDAFYAYIYPKNLAEFEAVKVMTPEIALGSQLTLDTEGICYHTTKVYSFSFLDTVKESQKYFLAVMNSPILWFFLTSTGYVLRGGYFTFKTEYLKPFPIKRINFKDKTEKAKHDELVKLVDIVLELKTNIANETSSRDKERLENKLHNTEGIINKIVYELYELNQDEIKAIENNMKQ